MAQFASATFTGTAFADLATADPNWSKQTGWTGNALLGSTGTYVINNTRSDGSGTAVYRHAGTPAGADYTVSADIAVLVANDATPGAGVMGRMQSGAQTCYGAIWTESSGNIRLFRWVAGAQVQLGSSYTYTLTTTPVQLRLRMVGSQISVELNGATIIGPVTDANITAAGVAGFYLSDNRFSPDDATSFDNFSGDDIGGGDTTAPTLTSPIGTGGSLVCSGSVSTNEANGTLYAVATASASAPSAAQAKAGQDHIGAAALRVVSQAVSATGVQTISSGACTAGTRYMHYMHEDAAANQSAVASSSSFVVDPAPATLTSSPLKDNTGTLHLSSPFEAFVLNVTTGALVLRKTGLTSHASTGVVTFSDAALTATTQYRVVWRQTATGAHGIELLTT